MQAADVTQNHHTNAPFKMCATCMITAKRMHKTKSEEMRGKAFLVMLGSEHCT